MYGPCCTQIYSQSKVNFFRTQEKRRLVHRSHVRILRTLRRKFVSGEAGVQLPRAVGEMKFMQYWFDKISGFEPVEAIVVSGSIVGVMCAVDRHSECECPLCACGYCEGLKARGAA